METYRGCGGGEKDIERENGPLQNSNHDRAAKKGGRERFIVSRGGGERYILRERSEEEF